MVDKEKSWSLMRQRKLRQRPSWKQTKEVKNTDPSRRAGVTNDGYTCNEIQVNNVWQETQQPGLTIRWLWNLWVIWQLW